MLSEKAEKIKSELENAVYINQRIENIKARLDKLPYKNAPRGYPFGSAIYVDGGSVNSAEKILVDYMRESRECEKEILELEAKLCEIVRKVNVLPHDWHCMIWDRYLTLPQPPLRELCRKYFYSDESNINRVYNQIFERLVEL